MMPPFNTFYTRNCSFKKKSFLPNYASKVANWTIVDIFYLLYVITGKLLAGVLLYLWTQMIRISED